MTCSKQDRPTARLRVAVEAAYNVFAHYHPGSQLATCHCDLCLEPGVEHRLLTNPLRKISLRLLKEYTWALSGSDRAKFDANEYRHFLTRYFHFIAYGVWPNFSDEQPTLRALGVHSYRERWPSLEVETIDEYCDALLERELAKPIGWTSRVDGSIYPYSNAADLVNTLAIAGASIDRLTNEWNRHMSGGGLYHAACIVDHCDRSRVSGMLPSAVPGAFWGECQSQSIALRSWIFRRQHLRQFQLASDAEVDLPTQDLVLRAAAIIQSGMTDN